MSESTRSDFPAFNVEIAGNAVTQAANADEGQPLGVVAVTVEDHVDMVGIAKATIHQGGMDWSSLTLGADVTAAFGGASDKVFTGIITGVRHHTGTGGMEFVTVIAMDPLCKLRASRQTRVFEEVTDSDIVSDVLGQAGCDPGTVDSTSASNKYVIQRNESDLMFLKRLAARNGYLLLSDPEGKVDFKKAQFSGSPIELDRAEVIGFDYTVSHQSIPPSLTVYGWSYMDKEKVEGTASSGDIETIGGGANAVDETGTIWQADSWISDVQVSDQGAATEMAKGELNRLARQFVRGRAKCHGRGDIRAGALIKFKGFATGFNPEAFVISSRHMIENNVFTTEFQFVSNTKPT